MSMPLWSALSPFALEIIIGRLPFATAGRDTPSEDGAAPKSFVLPAAAVPASEVKKNLRRDHRLMRASLNFAWSIYQWPRRSCRPLHFHVGNLRFPSNASAAHLPR